MNRTVFSFVVDEHPRFTYSGWHLARSLMEHCGGEPAAVHVQCTPEVDQRRRDLFRELGCTVHEIARFGDGRFCNKLNQLDNLRDVTFDRAVLLDTDTIAVADLRPFLRDDAIMGKIVDVARPPLEVLDEIAAAAGLTELPAVCKTDAFDEDTYLGNCNGGFYCVPNDLCQPLSAAWRRWALWLLDHSEPLRRIGRENHVDQVSFWLAIQQEGLPFAAAAANLNYFIHMDSAHRYLDETREAALIHYHHKLDEFGLLDTPVGRSAREQAAVERANRQLVRGFDNRVFWDLHYQRSHDRGPGTGSRDDDYKRDLLREQGVEVAVSVLDFGCGDLGAVKDLTIGDYVGVDLSPTALSIARHVRPDWTFRLAPAADLRPAETVLCLEVLIHQETEARYRSMIGFLADKTLGSLLVSGFQAQTERIGRDPTLFFHEPLETSLRRAGRFRRIEKVGAYADVVVYRCDI